MIYDLMSCYRSNNDWGWRIYAAPTNDVTENFDGVEPSATVKILESQHDDDSEVRSNKTVCIPEAKHLEVLFHELCATAASEVRQFIPLLSCCFCVDVVVVFL